VTGCRSFFDRDNIFGVFEQLEPDEWLQASITAYTGDLHPMQELLGRIAEPVT